MLEAAQPAEAMPRQLLTDINEALGAVLGVAFADSDDLKNDLREYVQEVRPTQIGVIGLQQC